MGGRWIMSKEQRGRAHSSIEVVDTRLGVLRVKWAEAGVCGVEFGGGGERRGSKVARELQAYAEGRRMKWSVPVDLSEGTEFQRAVLGAAGNGEGGEIVAECGESSGPTTEFVVASVGGVEADGEFGIVIENMLADGGRSQGCAVGGGAHAETERGGVHGEGRESGQEEWLATEPAHQNGIAIRGLIRGERATESTDHLKAGVSAANGQGAVEGTERACEIAAGGETPDDNHGRSVGAGSSAGPNFWRLKARANSTRPSSAGTAWMFQSCSWRARRRVLARAASW